MRTCNKITKESKLSLGSWLAFWAANTMCTQMQDSTLKFQRKTTLCKFYIYFKVLAKKRPPMPRFALENVKL